MNVYLIRHAQAQPLGEGGVSNDADRPLTPTGHEQAKLVAAGLQRRGVQLEVLVTSPLLRAQQTAAGICAQWPALELRECDDLAPGGKPRKLARYLRDGGGNAIGLVGHMPHLGEYTAWLIGSRKAQIDLAKAGVACVECPNGPRKGGGTLVWLVTPEWLS